jgi:hypothetical protein
LPPRFVPSAVVLHFVRSPRAVGFFRDPAHAAELSVQIEDAAHGLGLGRVVDGGALVRVG